MTRADDYREACVEYFEARMAFDAKCLSMPRGHVNGCRCADCLAWGGATALYDAERRAYRRCQELRPALEAPTEADKADVRGDEKMEGRRA